MSNPWVWSRVFFSRNTWPKCSNRTHHAKVRLRKDRGQLQGLRSSPGRVELPGFTIDERSAICRGWDRKDAAVSWRKEYITADRNLLAFQLWMGTHPTSPSRVRASNELLSKHLASHPTSSGGTLSRHSTPANGNLPFLFQSSVHRESVWASRRHPDKRMAEELHAKQPGIYKGCALFSSFSIPFEPKPPAPPTQTQTTNQNSRLAITHSGHCVGSGPSLRSPRIWTACPSSRLWSHPPSPPSSSHYPARRTPQARGENRIEGPFCFVDDRWRRCLPESRLRSRREIPIRSTNDGEDDDLIQLVLRLDSQFPGDIGIFCAFMLNSVHLNPGDAIYLGAGEPHAYIWGGQYYYLTLTFTLYLFLPSYHPLNGCAGFVW